MGLFDKINSITQKAAGMVDTYSKTLQNSIDSFGKALNNSKEDNGESKTYIPVLIDIKTTVPTGEDDGSTVEKIVGETHIFQLNGVEITFEENKDIYNSYRKAFSELAKKCADKAVYEYDSTVTDYISFIEKFPDIFDRNLYPLIKKAIDFLIAENILSISFEEFAKTFKSKCSAVCKDYGNIVESSRLSLEANREMIGKIMSAATDYATDKSSNQIQSFLIGEISKTGTDNTQKKAGITQKQQDELFERVNKVKDAFLKNIYKDYLNVCEFLVGILNYNHHNIWIPNYAKKAEINTIFNNIHNSNFPQDKIAETLVNIINENPYNEEYYTFILSKFGDTEETRKLIDYLGYSQLLS